MTRIIAGIARGRRLGVPDKGTRPTGDRVREALFSSLDSEWIAQGISWSQVHVLDLFAGSGALGLEALSRGAASAVLVEKSRSAARVIEANVATVGCPGATVLVRDAWQPGALPPPQQAVELCFADPPYDADALRLVSVLEDLRTRGWLGEGAVVVVERSAADERCPMPHRWSDGRRRTYGDTALWYGRVDAGAGEERG